MSGAEHEDSKGDFRSCSASPSRLFRRSCAAEPHGHDQQGRRSKRYDCNPAKGGAVGTSSGGVAEEYKVQDGLLFNAVKPGDKVSLTVTDIGGVKTITKLEKQ